MDLESFNVVMDSRTFYSAGAGGNSRQYYFDWSVIPDGKYELSFSFISDMNTIDPNIQHTIFSNMISPQNVFQAGSRIGANTIAYLGVLKPVAVNVALDVGANNVFQANPPDNPPVICNRPMTNIFTIGIYNGLSGALTGFDFDYVLTLYFKPLRLGLA